MGIAVIASPDGRKEVQVQIVSDEFNEDVPAGKCKVVGEVYHLGQLYKGAEVCSYKGKECVNTDKHGKFSILVDTSEIHVYAAIIGANTSYLNGYKFQSQHELTLRFYVNEKYSNAVMKKPVIYLYSDEVKEFQLSLDTDVELTFTYPTYQEGWNVKVDPTKGLSVDGVHYPYLFWEGKDYGELTYVQDEGKLMGEIIHTDTVISYLEERLKGYNLNSTEATDFITFWGPILAAKEYAFVQFMLDDKYGEIVETVCTEECAAERRVFMMFESFDEQPNMEVTNTQESVAPIERAGLILIEWGGAEVIIPKL
jgi:hypothetical protein